MVFFWLVSGNSRKKSARTGHIKALLVVIQMKKNYKTLRQNCSLSQFKHKNGPSIYSFLRPMILTDGSIVSQLKSLKKINLIRIQFFSFAITTVVGTLSLLNLVII